MSKYQVATTPDSKSRYGKVESKLQPIQPVLAHEIPEIIQNLRDTFRSDKTQSLEWRLKQLNQFRKMLIECEDELCQGMFKDLHKSPFEGYMTEISLVLSEVDSMLKNVEKWMKPQKKHANSLNIPAWASTQRDPLGVVLVMGAWNYPVQLSLAPMVGAIAGGNCVVLKPGSYATSTSNVLASIIPKYLDNDAVRVIEGDRHTTNALLEQRFEKIFFTGSGFVGRVVAKAAAEHLTPCVLELGGKSPCIIDKSADIEHAVNRLCWGAFLNSGQTCVRPDYLLVHESVADEFFATATKTIKRFYGEDAKMTEDFGRIINEGAFNRLTKLIHENKECIVTGGQSDRDDLFIAPTIFDFGTDKEFFRTSSLMQDEIFGPLLPCYRFSDNNEMIDLIRDSPTGKPLALYCFSTDTKFNSLVKSRTTAGGMCINDCLMHLVNHDTPFGGVGSSGMGNYHGKYSFDCFTHEKPVIEKSPKMDHSFVFKSLLNSRFPPYTKRKMKVLRNIGIFEKVSGCFSF